MILNERHSVLCLPLASRRRDSLRQADCNPLISRACASVAIHEHQSSTEGALKYRSDTGAIPSEYRSNPGIIPTNTDSKTGIFRYFGV